MKTRFFLTEGKLEEAVKTAQAAVTANPQSAASQYTLGYSSKNSKRDGAWRRVVVQVDRANATPRTKRGYYAPTTR